MTRRNTFEPLPGKAGLAKFVLESVDGARAEIYLHGAHLTSWVPARESRDRIFVSAASEFTPGTPIRGGVPICFPQFADQGPLPMHGLVRTQAWEPLWAGQAPDGSATAALGHESSQASLALWPHRFSLVYTVTVLANTLALELAVTNSGAASFEFTAALHTYLRVADARATRLLGLRGAGYRDKFLGRDDMRESAAALSIDTPLDRVYHASPRPLVVAEADRRTAIRAEGFADTVVWNPGPDRGAKLPDLEVDGYLRMLCVEAANARLPVVVEPGATWKGRQTLEAL